MTPAGSLDGLEQPGGDNELALAQHLVHWAADAPQALDLEVVADGVDDADHRKDAQRPRARAPMRFMGSRSMALPSGD